MSNEANEAPSGAPQVGEQDQAKTFDADYVDKLRKEAARYRTEAKANADAAKRLAEIEDAQKSEAEKAAERIATLERQVADAEVAATRSRIASEYRIDAADADLFLTASDEEGLRAQAKRLTERDLDLLKNGNRAPRGSQTNPPTGEDERRQFADFLTGHL